MSWQNKNHAERPSSNRWRGNVSCQFRNMKYYPKGTKVLIFCLTGRRNAGSWSWSEGYWLPSVIHQIWVWPQPHFNSRSCFCFYFAPASFLSIDAHFFYFLVSKICHDWAICRCYASEIFRVLGFGPGALYFSFLAEKKRARQTDAIKLAHKNKGCQRAATPDSKSDSCFGKCTLIKLNCSLLLFRANFLMQHLSSVLRVRSIEA